MDFGDPIEAQEKLQRRVRFSSKLFFMIASA